MKQVTAAEFMAINDRSKVSRSYVVIDPSSANECPPGTLGARYWFKDGNEVELSSDEHRNLVGDYPVWDFSC